MTRNMLYFLVLILTCTLFSGCVFTDPNVDLRREYTHNASSHVTINFYPGFENLIVINSNISEIRIIETFTLKKSFVKNSDKYVEDYVRFNGSDTNLTIRISVASHVDYFEMKDSNIRVIVYLPENTTYTINNQTRYEEVHTRE